VRIKLRGSSAGHRGVQSLIDTWRTDEFTRVRIGVGRSGESNDLVEHVLDPFLPEERQEVPGLIARAADAVIAIIRDGTDAAMNAVHRAG
jgi:peptidyl-tRNA hydrolase, PTH1 family